MQRLWRLGLHPVDRVTGAVDVVHATDVPPPHACAPVVLTIHDLCAVDRPDLHPARAVQRQRQALSALAGVALVLTPSQATADRLHQEGVPRDKILVTPLGLTRELHATDAPRPASIVDSPYFLHVGAATPRKNLAVLLEAMTQLSDQHLVLAGPSGPDTPRLERMVDELGLAGRVRFLGRVPDEDLRSLYANCRAFCFPTVGEGFGLPVLEAMAAGAAVVASDLPVLREVGADVPDWVSDPTPAGWADALGSFVEDVPRIHAGIERAAEFTWRRTAEATVAGYHLAAGRGPS